MTIRVENTREDIQVICDLIIDDMIHEFRLIAFDKNEWINLNNKSIPADVEAVLHQVYLNCRNMATVKWVKWTTYELDADDKMFEPIRKWLGANDED